MSTSSGSAMSSDGRSAVQLLRLWRTPLFLQLRSLALSLLDSSGPGWCGGLIRSLSTPDRITSPVVASVRTKTNAVHPLATKQNDLGRVSGAKVFHRMVLMLQGSEAQKADLAQLLKDQQDSKSAQYHKWLTPAQFGERFGPSTNDMAKVTGWLTAQGFSVEKPTNGRRFLLFTGTGSQVEAAFQTEIHTYQRKRQELFCECEAGQHPGGPCRGCDGRCAPERLQPSRNVA